MLILLFRAPNEAGILCIDHGTQMLDEGDVKLQTDVAENRQMLVTVDVS